MLPELINHKLPTCPNGCRINPIKRGFYFRNKIKTQRFLCKLCHKSFSYHVNSDIYYEKKVSLRHPIFMDLVSQTSQRRCALKFKISRTTVVRKMKLLAQFAQFQLNTDNLKLPKVFQMQFDDLETFCHTKCKPLSVIMAVEHKTRRILDFEVADMPAKGKLTHIAFKKYGQRVDERSVKRKSLFERLKSVVTEDAIIQSDQSPHYPGDVKKYFPQASHITYKGRRGCVVGQGELKAVGHDPLFSLNHTYAMLRANLNRLARKTWCTTKLKERLSEHLMMYVLFHNHFVIHNKSK